MKGSLFLKTRKPEPLMEQVTSLQDDGEAWGCKRPNLQSMVALQLTTRMVKDWVSKAESLDMMIICLSTTFETTQEKGDFEGFTHLTHASGRQAKL